MKRKHKQKAEFDLNTIINDPVKLKQLIGFVQEAVLCKRKIAAENEQIKDIRAEAIDVLGIPGKLFNKIIRAKFKDDFQVEKRDFEMFEETMNVIGGDEA